MKKMGLRDLLQGKKKTERWDVEREETISSPQGETTTTYYTPRGTSPQTKTVTKTREWREELPRPTSMGFRIAEAKHQEKLTRKTSKSATPRRSIVQQLAKFDANINRILGPKSKGARYHAPKRKAYKPPNIRALMNKLGTDMNRSIYGTPRKKRR